MPRTMADRIQSFGTSIFTEINTLAQRHGAVNLGQGAPDFQAPHLLKHAAAAAIDADQNQYAPAPGVLPLREVISASYLKGYGLHYDAQSEITITSGATEAIFAAVMALVDPGDEVVIVEPAYDSYVPAIVMAGGRPRTIALHPSVEPSDPGWRLDVDELRAACGPRTRMIIINTPHNPTGKVWSKAELQMVADLAQELDALVLSDEVYDRLVFAGDHVPVASLPGMRDRTITVNSTGKTFSVTGWKIGYAMTTPPLTEAIRRAHQFITFSTATPLQVGMAAALDDALRGAYYQEFLAFYAERRALLLASLAAAGLQAAAPEGAYFVLASLPAGWTDDATFCRYLTSEIGVAAIPTSVFYMDRTHATHMARFCFAKRRETLEAAGERLARLREVAAK